MRKFSVILVGTIIFVGEIILLLVLLSAIGSFFPEDVVTFPPTSSDYVIISILFLIRLIAVAIAVLLLRREILRARSDWANPRDFWFLNNKKVE